MCCSGDMRKLPIFSLQHILYLLDTYSKNSDRKIFRIALNEIIFLYPNFGVVNI